MFYLINLFIDKLGAALSDLFLRFAGWAKLGLESMLLSEFTQFVALSQVSHSVDMRLRRDCLVCYTYLGATIYCERVDVGACRSSVLTAIVLRLGKSLPRRTSASDPVPMFL